MSDIDKILKDPEFRVKLYWLYVVASICAIAGMVLGIFIFILKALGYF